METAIAALLGMMLQVVEGVLPTVEKAAAPAIITTIVTALEKWVPLITTLFPTAVDLYHAIKNIIAALTVNPATTEEQLTTLEDLDAKVDTAFEAAAKDVDPGEE